MQTRPPGSAILYLRDSAGTSDNSPVQYLPWAQEQARKYNLRFRADDTQVRRMLADGKSADGDLYLDYGVPGNVMSRPGFDAMLKRIETDMLVSHLFVPRRDRLARPDQAIEGAVIELNILKHGVTIVMTDDIAVPCQPGERFEIAGLIKTLMAYDSSGRFRTELADKLTKAKIILAEAGFSIGGEPMYGFERWLIDAASGKRRKLEKGENVKMKGCHVIWLPTAERELAVVRRILKDIATVTACRLARRLNDEGIPSPHSGRGRTENGLYVPFSGLWTQTTVRNIARNPNLVAVYEYGRRNEGTQKRMTRHGSRSLNVTDFRDGKPVTVRNPVDTLIVTKVPHFEPIIPPEMHATILATLDERGKHLLGKTRTRDYAAAPLDGRVFDMNCGWPMYRARRQGKIWYACGLYMNTAASECGYNRIAAETGARFVVSALRGKFSSHAKIQDIRDRISQIARTQHEEHLQSKTRAVLEGKSKELNSKRERVSENMALAENPEQFKAMSKTFDDLTRQLQDVTKLLEREPVVPSRNDFENEVNGAQARLDECVKELDNATAFADITRTLFVTFNVRLFLKFENVIAGKRAFTKPFSGVLALGLVPSPIPLYTGPTDRERVRKMRASGIPVRTVPECVIPGVPVPDSPEAESTGNVKRVTKRCSRPAPHVGFLGFNAAERLRLLCWFVRRRRVMSGSHQN